MRILTTLTLLILTLGLSAQVTDYFAENPEWRQYSLDGDESACVQRQEYIYYINGDSVINDTVYKKLFKIGDHFQEWYSSPPIPDWCNSSWTFNNLYALIRQEEYKIFIRDSWHSWDTFVYDFDLKVGDTIPLSIVNWEENIIVTSIDSLLVGNHYRKVFNFFSYDGPDYLIEGIGNDGGFLEYLSWGGGSVTHLNCFALNNITYYPELNAPCDLSVNLPAKVKQKVIKYYPNPTRKSITIEVKNSAEISKISAYNIIGLQTSLNFEILDKSSLKIDLSILNNGLYFILLINNENTKLTLKVVKE